MKELEQLSKVEIVETPEIKKQKTFLFNTQLKRGCKFWEINVLSQEISEAQYEESVVEMRKLFMPQMYNPKIVPVEVRKLMLRENCLYYPAINKENAMKKYEKDKKKILNGIQ